MSRFIWTGLYGNLDPDLEPERPRQVEMRPVTYFYQCPHCDVQFTYQSIAGAPPPAQILQSIASHLATKHAPKTPMQHALENVDATAARLKEEFDRFVGKHRAPAPADRQVDPPGVTTLHRNKDGVYE